MTESYAEPRIPPSSSSPQATLVTKYSSRTVLCQITRNRVMVPVWKAEREEPHSITAAIRIL